MNRPRFLRWVSAGVGALMLGFFVVPIALSSPAQAGNSFSFVVAGHRITIEAPRGCDSRAA